MNKLQIYFEIKEIIFICKILSWIERNLFLHFTKF